MKQEQQEEVEEEEQQQQLKQLQQRQQQRIYDVTAGIQSKYTRNSYEVNFNRFLNKIKIHDRQVLLDFSSKVIKQMIIDYIHYLSEEREIKRDSIKTQIAPIIHFFKINNDDFNLRMDNFKLYLPPRESISEDRPYTREEIEQIIRVCDHRAKVVVLLLCSSGMRIGALHSLQIGHLTKIKIRESEYEFNTYKIQAYAGTPDRYFTFCTPECAAAIDGYLDYRARYGEKLKDNSSSPLIREQFNSDNPFTPDSPRFVSDKTMEYLLMRVLKQSGVRKVGEVHMSHGFRKFFMTLCERSGMKSINVKMLLGHDIGVSGHYYRPQESDILEDYMSHAADALTVDPTKRLQQKVQDLEGQQAQEIDGLKAQLQNYKEEQEARDKQSHDISKQALEELRMRIDETSDRYEGMFRTLEYLQRTTLYHKENEKKELEEMSPRFRKMYLEWQQKTDYGKKESLVDYYARNRKKYFDT